MTIRKTVLTFFLILAVIATASSVSAKLESSEYNSRVKEFKAAVKSKDFSAAAHQAERVAEDDSSRAVKVIISEAVKSDSGQLIRAITPPLSKMNDAEAVKAMTDILQGSKWKEQIIVAETFGWRGDEATLKALVEALGEKKEEVLRVVLESLKKRRCSEIVEPLIKFLEEHESDGGRLCGDAKEILRLITGERLDKAADYRAWWENYGGKDFKKPEKSKEEQRYTTASFFGVEIASKRCVFIIDVSGSMQRTDPLPPPGDEGEGSSPKTGKGLVGDGDDEDDDEGVAPIDPNASRVRIERAKAELIKVVKVLPGDTKFTILAFSSPGAVVKKGEQPKRWTQRDFPKPTEDPKAVRTVVFWKPRLIKADKKNKESAIDFVKDFTAAGKTFTDDVLKEAFKVKDADTFYFLTDGMPDKYGLEPIGYRTPTTDEILQLVANLNAMRRIKINTFGFVERTQQARRRPRPAGMPSAAAFTEFLKKLAKENGGKFRELR
ncbi:MAG: hypothetical protein ACYS8W_13865 [Planctomycetota bacterium]|jgi:hypothetical protein